MAKESLNQCSQINKTQSLYIDAVLLWFKVAIIICMDLKAIWTIMGVGGSSSKTDFFCPFCPMRCHKRWTANIDKCANCVRKNRVRCFCCPIVSGDTIDTICSDAYPKRKLDTFIKFPNKDSKKDVCLQFVQVSFSFLS